jgi:hypothetical protein
LKEKVMALLLGHYQATALSADGVADYGSDMAKDVHAAFRPVYADTDSGFNVSLPETHSAAAAEHEFERAGLPFDAINEAGYALSTLEPMQMLARG